MNYEEFIVSKSQLNVGGGFEPLWMPDFLFPFQQSLTDWSIRKGRSAIFADCGLGKGLPLDARVLGDAGWRRIGSLSVGDMVMGRSGHAYPVTGIYFRGIQSVYQVSFSDGVSLVCDSDHLWAVKSANDSASRPWRLLSTGQLVKSRLHYGKQRSRTWRVPLVEPLHFASRSCLPLHPYILGCLLGDGSLDGTPRLHGEDAEIAERIADLLPPQTAIILHDCGTRCSNWSLINNPRNPHIANPICEVLRELGLWGLSGAEKFIPYCYLFSSPFDRLQLLQGLMDTDGYCGDPTPEFSNCSPALAEGVVWLVESLGGIAHSSRKKEPHCEYKERQIVGSPAYRVTMSLPSGINPFSLARKADKYRPTSRGLGRWIESIKAVGEQETVCISVASPDGLYVTEHCIVTHNTPMQLVWAENVARKTGKRVLIITPLAVSAQTIREAEKFGIEAVRSREGQLPLTSHIVVTNYEQLHYYHPEDFIACVADECFAFDTPIDTPRGKMYIKDIARGDEILNAYGNDRVVAVKRRRIENAMCVRIRGQEIFCSSNHPWFTRSGWKRAICLSTRDEVLATSQAMRMVREGIHHNLRTGGQDSILREILLREMENVPARHNRQGSHQGNPSNNRNESEQMVTNYARGKEEGQEICSNQANDDSRNEGKGFPNTQANGSSSAVDRRKGENVNEAAEYSFISSRRGMAGGVSSASKSPATRTSKLLLSRPCKSGQDDYYRSRRSDPLLRECERGGSPKGIISKWTRVESVEILESGHPKVERLRDSSGELYFYDIQAARHPSFSVAGLLVHNSSILKNFDGERRKQITAFIRAMPYRLLCTATPSPNDYIELGTSSEALGYLDYPSMLTRFFREEANLSVSDRKRRHVKHGQELVLPKWVFKSYAEQFFWRWTCSWSRAIRKPSDIGFCDDGFILPPLTETQHMVKINTLPPGKLLHVAAVTMHEQLEERRRTIQERCEKAAELACDGKPALVWCNLNPEGDLIEKLIPGSVQIAGKDPDEVKEERWLAFLSGQVKVIVTKHRIGAFGLNLQHCAHEITFPTHSWESYKQAVCRCWRFGQKNPVKIDIVTTEAEHDVMANLQRKQVAADRMFEEMLAKMNEQLHVQRSETKSIKVEVPGWMNLTSESPTDTRSTTETAVK